MVGILLAGACRVFFKIPLEERPLRTFDRGYMSMIY
ncbi:MAG: hypothetical protein M2R45_01229 [Verrucomicrobia subdivision 3 bacterium]|nr:hypothetical protein [Limisphaerales bacterium]MCS1415219.1 hypothetical protein [Limisphaerales bacterium]